MSVSKRCIVSFFTWPTVITYIWPSPRSSRPLRKSDCISSPAARCTSR